MNRRFYGTFGRRKLAFLILGIWICLAAPRPASAEYGYTLRDYDAELVPEAQADGTIDNLRVQLSITYDIENGPKESGFKYVGTRPVSDISVTDGRGNPLRFRHTREREHKITWFFPPVRRGLQRVIVTFRISNLRLGTDDDTAALEWLNHWRIPVRHVTYRMIAPRLEGGRQLTTDPEPHSVIETDRRRTLVLTFDRLPKADLSLKVARSAKRLAVLSWIASVFMFLAGKLLIMVLTIVGLAAFIYLFLLFVKFVSRFGSGRGGKGGGGGGCSGCAGGCGSGGGCGGGGCGG